MPRETNHTNVMAEIFSTELSSDPEALSQLQYFGF
ncbi:hypothetical protein GALL_548460 [mine drainage metagenome]|uniref:Uncharacterized protein n=1 Tax=mine drainage metagenome TaxID=410659 RepID=A0A1J5PJ72_9ZZZZ